ncbi:hypothetical protein HGM15179_021869, partial [Zosterops borbonicus]
KELPSSLRNMAFVLARKGKVKKELLKEVVENDNWRVNNKYDRSYTPYSVEKIIQRAKERIDSKVRKIVASTVAGAIIASIIIISPTVASAIVKLWRGKIFFKILYI